MMFYKELDNGKYRYYEKFYDKRDKKWKQVTVTLKSRSRVSQAEAKRRLATKIDKILMTPTKEELKQQKYEATTFSQLLAEWKTIRASEIKSSSFRSEMKCLQFFADAVGDLKLSEYTTQQIQSYLMSLNVENSTRKNRKIYLNGIFGYAEKVGYITKSPVKNVVIPKQKADYEKLKKAKEHFISREELGKVLSYCENHNKDRRYTLAMEFIFLTGLRFAEFIGVRYQDIDFENCLLKIDHTIDYVAHKYDERVLQTTKTVGSVRTIILSERCIEIVLYFREHCRDEEFVFVTEQGNIMRQPLLYKFIKNSCDTVLGEGKAYNIHMLRHSHISLLAELGLPIKAIMERVGHRDESITLQVYSHVTENIQDEVRTKLNQIHL
jgi:intTn5276 protein